MPSRTLASGLLLAAAALGGCGLAGSGRAPVLDPGVPPPAGTRALRLGLGAAPPTAYAVLLQENGQRRLWRTADGFALATDGARVVATAGLPQMLMATRIDGPDPLAAPEALVGQEGEARRLVDLATAARDPAGMRFGLEIACRLRAAADAEEPALLQVEESCRGPDPVGAFVNRFTLQRADGAVLRSEQWIGPGLPRLTVEAAGS